jgi:AcrR family transcriptional regulator
LDRIERHGAREAGRRRLKPEARRLELIEAALVVLRDRDLSEVRVEDVTREAGAAKGTFYLYFSSWGDLLDAVRDHVLTNFTSALLDRFAIATTASEWWAALEEECTHFVQFHLELGTLHQAMFHSAVSKHSACQDQSDEVIIARLLRQGIALGACRELNTEMAAPLVFSLLHSTADAISKSNSSEGRLGVLMTLLRSWLSLPDTAPPRPSASAATVSAPDEP